MQIIIIFPIFCCVCVCLVALFYPFTLKWCERSTTSKMVFKIIIFCALRKNKMIEWYCRRTEKCFWNSKYSIKYCILEKVCCVFVYCMSSGPKEKKTKPLIITTLNVCVYFQNIFHWESFSMYSILFLCDRGGVFFAIDIILMGLPLKEATLKRHSICDKWNIFFIVLFAYLLLILMKMYGEPQSFWAQFIQITSKRRKMIPRWKNAPGTSFTLQLRQLYDYSHYLLSLRVRHLYFPFNP